MKQTTNKMKDLRLYDLLENEKLANKMNVSAFVQMVDRIQTTFEDFDGFLLAALREKQKAICEGAIAFEVLFSIGYTNSPKGQNWFTFSYETKEGRSFNFSNIISFSGGFVKYLTKYSEDKIFTYSC